MKKNRNLFLFLALVILLGLTYWFEEKGTLDKNSLEKKKYSILDVSEFGELKSVKGIKLNFIKTGESYFSAENNLAFSTRKMDEFFLILAGLKTRNSISKEDVLKVGKSFYIPDETMKMSFHFEKGSLEFVLGKKLDYDQAFYMQVTKNGDQQIFVVNDESPDPGVYANESEFNKSAAKYKRLEMMFLLTNVFFYDTKVFAQHNYNDQKINFKTIDISTFRNRKFRVDLEKTVTEPRIPEGLSYDEDNWISFHKILTNLEGKNIFYPIKESNLNEVLSHLEVEDRDGKTYSLDIYKKYGSLTGYFLKTSFSKILFELKNEDAMYFFVNVQDFWKKELAPASKEYELKIVFKSDKSSIQLINISDKELFNATSKNKSLRILEVKKLVDFLKLRGDHVSIISPQDKNLEKDIVLDLYFDNRHLGVMLEENDVSLIDYDKKIKLHHYVGKTIPFHFRLQDYFEKI